jgi:hypothetical protein
LWISSVDKSPKRVLREGIRRGSSRRRMDGFFSFCSLCGKSFRENGKTVDERMKAFKNHICDRGKR